jgi:hypothetical protein
MPSFMTRAEESEVNGTPLEPDRSETFCAEAGVFVSDEEDNQNTFSRWKGKSKEGALEPDGLGNEEEWKKMRLETVECEVPLTVYPGHTAFRPTEVVFNI